MSWLKRSLSVAVFAALVAVPAHAQISGHPIEASLGAGMNRFDTRDGIDNAFAFTGSAGWRVSESRTLELSWLNAPSTLKPSGAKHQWSYSAVDVRWNLADPAEKAVPYVLTGFGLGRANGPVGIARMGAPSLGAGFLFSLAGQQRTYLRLQVRDVMFRELNATEFSHHIASTIGVQFSWGGKAKDQDLDGVRNWLDQCPNTPIGAKVAA